MKPKQTNDYFLFSEYLFPTKYTMTVIVINTIKNKLIGATISVLKRNIFMIIKEIHRVKRTTTARGIVLIGKGRTTNISLNENCLMSFNVFGGYQ
jgi:hypothetical protein